MAQLNTYLTFEGKAEEAFNFYKSVFGGEFTMIQRFKDTPDSDKLSEEEKNRVMHIGLQINESTVLMASDTVPSMGYPFVKGTNYTISINANSEAEADQLFNGLSAGGMVTMPLQKTFWNAYFGMWNDKFGIQWMINYDYPQA